MGPVGRVGRLVGRTYPTYPTYLTYPTNHSRLFTSAQFTTFHQASM
jgi:hypothetical protein